MNSSTRERIRERSLSLPDQLTVPATLFRTAASAPGE